MLGTEALRLWDSQPVPYPFHCLALWPLTATYLNAGETEKAIGAARRMLEPPQLRMPDELEASVTGSLLPHETAQPSQAAVLLADAIELARNLGYA